ncbi:MAG: hypothetical protein ACTSU5_07500 [Promethearchaeota archaeon]
MISLKFRILRGMIKLRKAVDVNQTARYLELSPAEIRELVDKIVAEGQIDGHWEGNVFKFETTDVSSFIDDLEASFHDWEGAEVCGTGKNV